MDDSVVYTSQLPTVPVLTEETDRAVTEQRVSAAVVEEAAPVVVVPEPTQEPPASTGAAATAPVETTAEEVGEALSAT